MSLQSELYDFFNEARPRTVNVGVDDIEKSGSGRKPSLDRGQAPEKMNISQLPPDVASQKSSFEDGKVHEIWFKNIGTTQSRKYFHLYRKLSKQDFDKIFNGSKSAIIGPKIIPSDKEEHYVDLYYLKPQMGMPNEKEGFLPISKKQVEYIKSEFPKYAEDLELVSIDDIADGINLRYYDFDKVIEKWQQLKASRVKSKEKSDTEKQKGIDKEKSIEDAIGTFLVDNGDTLDKIISLYNQSRQPGKKPEDIKDYKELLSKFLKRYVDRLKDEKTNVVERVFGALREKLSDKNPLYNMIKAEYDGTSKSTIEPKSEPEKQTSKGEPSDKPKDVKSTDKSSDYKERASKFMVDPKNVSTLNKLIQAFSESEDKEKNDKIEREYQRNQIFKIMPELLKQIKGFSDSVDVKDYIVKELIRNRIAALTGDDNTELYTMISKTYDKMKAKKETINEGVEIKDDEMYNVSVKYDGGKYTDVRMPGKSLKKLVGSQDLEFNKELPFERSVYDPQKEKKENVKGILKINTPSVSKGPLKLIGRRTPEGDPIYKDPSTKSAEKEKVPIKTFTTSVSGQGARSYKVPVNLGVKMADIKPSQLRFKYYVIDTANKELVNGSDDWAETKKMAQEMGSDFEAVQRAALSSKGVKINEAISEEDKNILKNYRVSFTTQDNFDSNKKYNVKDSVKDYKDEKTKFIINLVQVGTLTFDKSGTTTFKDNKDEEFQVVSVPDTLSKIVKKSFEAQDSQSSTDSKLESYIRKRIKEAIKEAEVSQYWGYQGKDVKKKRLEEYLKRYDWGFQDSDNPYTHAEGSAKHAIVSKLVHELVAMGVDAVAIFNSYAPDGYQVSDLDQLDYASDSPLGSQLTQPYNPDSLTARGGRVAEMNGPVPTKGQGADQLDRLVANITPQLKDDIIAKGSAKNAEGLISVFRQAKGIAKDNKNPNDKNNVTDEMIFKKIKGI